MRVSFCTTCHNRAFQLKTVFEQNLRTVLAEDDVEWIILNYNSTDDIDDFIFAKLSTSANRIVYARETSGRLWHSSIAKNIAHKLGTGDILMNLDCDNYISDATCVIRKIFAGAVGALQMFSGD